MTTDGGIRASDHDRENVVEVLREAYAAGRLDLDEFDQRTTAAYSAKTWGDLRELTSDLPAEPKLGADLGTAAREVPEPAAVDAGVQYSSRRPFAPVLPMALVWLAIAAAAHTSAAVIPLILLALFALRAAGGRRRPPDHRQRASPSHRPTGADDVI